MADLKEVVSTSVLKDGGLKVSIVGKEELTEVPKTLAASYTQMQELSISYCSLRYVSNIKALRQLTSLVLDNNEIGDDNSFYPLPNLETLWINHNNISRLDRFLDEIDGKFPKLNYLSMLKNPCCPNYLVGKGSADYKEYRITVISRLPALKFLDASPVTSAERQQADAEASRVAKPNLSQYKSSGTSPLVPAASGLDTLGPTQTNPDDVSFGTTKYVYYGKHSEGNRFIRDTDL
eukprot:TRINITY_DN1733_c0_g1_i1.p1 TRINITY_DN1733_c0_g1~~TRINITY_DN1733_c0_g1_i1.p1  ORF type:complete len:253 (+),score=52.29 TRINITY_DN1733_c0_g1_i1:55-759(+)